MALTPAPPAPAPRRRSTLAVTTAPAATWVVRIARAERGNTLTPEVVAELTEVVAEAEAAGVTALALGGTAEVFCTGMDLAGAATAGPDQDGAAFWDLLAALRTSPLLVVALVEAAAAGGGIGLVAASDVVLATPAATFALPEALWGLLPCCIAPFLVERVGRHVALEMALLTTPVDAAAAAAVGLVDRVVEDVGPALRQLSLRAGRIDPAVRARTKRYFARLPERALDARELALGELADVMGSPLVTRNLTRFAQEGIYPWET